MWDEARVYPIEVRDVDDAAKVMRGVAAPYNEPTPIKGLYLEVLAPGVFAKSIREAAKNLPLLSFHDHGSWPVGKALRWEESPAGLIGEWQFAPTEEGEKAWELAREGFVSGLSVGFQPIDSHTEPGTDTRPVTITRKVARLYETSMVTAPAYAGAQILMVRTAGPKRSHPHADMWREWASKNLAPGV